MCMMYNEFFTLKRPNYRGYMTRAELQKEAQPFCEASFTMVITVFNYVPITCSNKLDKNSYSKYSSLNSCASMYSTHE